MPSPSPRLVLMMAEAHSNLAAVVHDAAERAREDIGRQFDAAYHRLNRSAGQYMRQQKRTLQHGKQ